MTVSNVVATKLVYTRPPSDGARAFQTINANPETGKRDQNIEHAKHDMEVENVRGREDSYTLDTAGFQFYTRPTDFKDFRDNKRVQEEYYPEAVALIKELTKASRVVIFDHSRFLVM